MISTFIEEFLFFGIGFSGFGIGVVIAALRHYIIRNVEVFRPFVVSVMAVISGRNICIRSQVFVSVSVKGRGVCGRF